MKKMAHQKWVILLLMVFAAQISWAEDAKETNPTSQAVDKTEASDKFYLPSINEIYRQAKKYGVTGKWKQIVRIEEKAYATMPLPQRAFEVGKSLSNIAFVVLDTDSNEAAPSKSVVLHANDAIMSLNPPADINAELQKLRDQLEAGTLQGKALRDEVNSLISQTIPKILDKEPSLQDAGLLVLGAGYFRAMYLGTSTVASYPKPTQAQLGMFRWGSIVDYFIDHFTQKASPEFQKSTEVRSFVVALTKIQPLINKAPEQISKADVSQVASTLASLFN